MRTVTAGSAQRAVDLALGPGNSRCFSLARGLPWRAAMNALRLAFGILAVAAAACGAASSPSPSPSSNDDATDAADAADAKNDQATEIPDGGWMNRCRREQPIRWYVYNTDHTSNEPLHDDCEALPAACESDASITDDPRSLDGESTCACVVDVKKTKNDAGLTSCPGNGPIYCDVLEDGSLVVRCSPP